MASDQEPSMKLYVGLWIVMICIAGVEVLMTYQHLSHGVLTGVLLVLAFVEGGFALAFFMHLKYESPNLFWTLVPITFFALLMLDHIWPDAFRLARMSMFH
jgi:cytochrome c oxidase subunit IV